MYLNFLLTVPLTRRRQGHKAPPQAPSPLTLTVPTIPLLLLQLQLLDFTWIHVDATKGVLEPVARAVSVREEVIGGVAIAARVRDDPARAKGGVDFVENGRHFGLF